MVFYIAVINMFGVVMAHLQIAVEAERPAACLQECCRRGRTCGAWAALGLCLYFNQLFYIIGIDMSGVVVATCMQPTIPVFTAMIAVMVGLEAGSLQKFVGIVLAVGGSICMVSMQSS